MGTFLKVMLVIALMLGSFAGGWYTSNRGFRVVNADGQSLVKSNAAQIVKDENARLSREVVGKAEGAASAILNDHNRTMFVGMRDGKPCDYVGQKTFTNLTVEVKDGKVIRVMGWY